jgi:hypothetical protein
MKHIVIAGLLAAIGAVAFAGGAKAESRYCYNNPDDNRCVYDPEYTPRRSPPPPPDDYGDEEVPDVGYDRPRPRPPQLGDYDAPRPPGAWSTESRRRYCWRVGQSLRDYGYRRVRPVECGGNSFKYTAYRGYQRYVIKVKARTGRIMYELPN